jgi:hypothetical protein
MIFAVFRGFGIGVGVGTGTGGKRGVEFATTIGDDMVAIGVPLGSGDMTIFTAVGSGVADGLETVAAGVGAGF